jgi:TetR/AcrR family transcriptional repressor of nem operon
MPRASVREKLLIAGMQVLWKQGYADGGVRDIVAMAGARPGSFTNHFASKEEFAEQVLERYGVRVEGLIGKILSDETASATQRLKRYLDFITDRLGDAQWARGCMAGNLSLEMANSSERLREKLEQIFLNWRALFAKCIAEGQAQGEIAGDFTAEELADFLISGWQGAILRMKVARSPEPLERFKKVIFATVFAKDQQ